MSEAALSPTETRAKAADDRQAQERVDPIPPMPVRRWNAVTGFLFYVWVLFIASIVTVVGVIIAFGGLLFDRSGRLVWFLTLAWSRIILWSAGAKVERIDESKLPDGPVIFVCNHQSAFDILALFVALGRRFVFVAKKDLARVPFLGWYIAAGGYILVDRANQEAAIRSLAAGGELIRAGRSVAVFPEGTRSRDGSILPFKKGPFMLALNARVPIVPVAIEGSLQVNPRKALYVCPNTIRVIVGEAQPTEGITEASRDDLIRRVRGSMIRMHRRLGGLGGDESNAIAAAGIEGIGRAARTPAASAAQGEN